MWLLSCSTICSDDIVDDVEALGWDLTEATKMGGWDGEGEGGGW